MNEFSEKGIYFLPLGGADEIGMNMYVYVVNGKMLVVDAGYGFLADDYPGMELAYASPEFFAEHQGQIEGLFVTHAHEDHMGAVGQIWPYLKCPIYASDFTLGLIKERLAEFKLDEEVPLISATKTKCFDFEDFSVEFIQVAHSVPQTCALAIRTKYGNILHATDWRFDDEKLSVLPTDFEALKRFSDQGVDMLVCDSTNVMVNEKLPSESDVRKSLLKLIPQIEGGVIVTLFSSNLVRLESLIMAAEEAGRSPVLFGRSLLTNIKIARECGYFQDFPKVYSAEEAKDIPADNAMYICTGSQANYRSALMSIANGESKYVKIDASDTVIFSSKVIPGNEARIERLQDKFEETGAKVITDETALVHASGHANRDDLKKMYDLLKPAIVLPVHGDKKFIREHKRFALTCGVNDVFSARNGEVCLLRDKSIEKIAEVPTDILAWDRNHPVSLGSDVIKNRRRIAYNCSLFIGVLIKEAKVADLQISSIDILEEKAWEELSSRIAEEVRPLIDKKLQESDNKSQIEDFIRGQIRRRVFQATEIKPVTFLQMFFA